MSREHLARLRGIIGRRLGLSLDETREIELVEAVARRLAERRRPSLAGYLDVLETDDEELRALAELLTVGETCFFRTREHFEVLRDVVLPARPRSRGGALKILSAGCSSGEEPYSLAIFLRDLEDECRPATWQRWQVHGVDLNRR
ncbi:MAG TPA: CheR family methyltransferase, partial [Labilithrix sp.]|nr:CheR family methyltransferase [Labilithrix sp.]